MRLPIIINGTVDWCVGWRGPAAPQTQIKLTLNFERFDIVFIFYSLLLAGFELTSEINYRRYNECIWCDDCDS